MMYSEKIKILGEGGTGTVYFVQLSVERNQWEGI